MDKVSTERLVQSIDLGTCLEWLATEGKDEPQNVVQLVHCGHNPPINKKGDQYWYWCRTVSKKVAHKGDCEAYIGHGRGPVEAVQNCIIRKIDGKKGEPEDVSNLEPHDDLTFMDDTHRALQAVYQSFSFSIDNDRGTEGFCPQ